MKITQIYKSTQKPHIKFALFCKIHEIWRNLYKLHGGFHYILKFDEKYLNLNLSIFSVSKQPGNY